MNELLIAIATVMLLSVVGSLGALLGYRNAEDKYHAKAVEVGAAVWVVNQSNGSVRFVWNTELNNKKEGEKQ